MKGFALGVGVGAALAYFLDPDKGKRRRNMARDQLMAATRRYAGQAKQQVRHTASTAYGLSQKASNLRHPEEVAPDDDTLLARVETEVLRDREFPKGDINMSVENGTVVLRGELRSQEEINALESKVRNVRGVYDVTNLLHLPGTVAPNKMGLMQAEERLSEELGGSAAGSAPEVAPDTQSADQPVPGGYATPS